MCGRFTHTTPAEVVADRFGVADPPALPPRFNVAPSQVVAVVGLKPGGTRRGLAMLRWVLVPRWAATPKPGPTNARAETVDRLPTFRDSFRERRCLLTMTGFYEWRLVNGRKVPHHFTLAGCGPMGVAGIWAVWHGSDGTNLTTCCLLTTTANEAVRPVHDRMPAVLPPDVWGAGWTRLPRSPGCSHCSGRTRAGWLWPRRPRWSTRRRTTVRNCWLHDARTGHTSAVSYPAGGQPPGTPTCC